MRKLFLLISCVILVSAPSSAQMPGTFNPLLTTVVNIPIGTPTSIGSAVANTNVGTTTFTTTASITAGNLVCVSSAGQDVSPADAISSITVGVDSLASVVVQSSSGGDMRGETWCKANATAQSSGVTVTVTYTGAILYGVAIGGLQVSGISTTSPVDKTAIGPGTAITNPTVSTGALSQPKELLICSMAGGGSAITNDAGNGFTQLINVASGNAFAQLYISTKTVAATATTTCAPTQASANFEALTIATFKGT